MNQEQQGGSEESERPAEDNSGEAMLWCPTCSARLEQSKCKLICPRCGYYMSCADYY